MMGLGFMVFKVWLLLSYVLFINPEVYGQSPKKDGSLQELTSVMQRSDFLKNIELESSTVEACDWDGDDSACPFMPPESSEFFIRTGTKMSCANAAATNFLKNEKLSYLDLKITDIMDSRSRARSVLSRDTSRRDYAKFKGEERVTFSLVAWTTVESVDSGIEKWSRWDNSAGGYGANHFVRGRYVDMINGRKGNDGSKHNYIHKGIWLQNINEDTNGWTSWIKKVQRKYFLALNDIQYVYDELVKSTRHCTNNDPRCGHGGWVHDADRNRWVDIAVPRGPKVSGGYKKPERYADNPLILPPLAHRVHVIAYDDDVMPNAGEALLRCADEVGGLRGDPKHFEPEKAFDRRVCLNHDDWRRAKVEETSSQIAKRNKRLIKAYFAKVYDPKSSDVIYRPWEGNPEKTTPYSKKPSLVYATYFAVQSCHTSPQDIPHAPLGSVGTAYNRIKSLKDKITTTEGQKSLREAFWRNLEFAGFGGLEDWSCEPRDIFDQCECRMKLDDDTKNEHYFSIISWNPVKTVRLDENHGGVKSDLNKVKCFKALKKTFADDGGAEYHNCSYWLDRSIVTHLETGHKRCRRMAEITKYCAGVQNRDLRYGQMCADRGAE